MSNSVVGMMGGEDKKNPATSIVAKNNVKASSITKNVTAP